MSRTESGGSDWHDLIDAAVALDVPIAERLATGDARSTCRAGQAAAVLIAIEAAPNPVIYFTQRSASLRHHPGQISFPGGRLEARDADLSEAALRESREEIGLDSAHVSLVGVLPRYATVTGFAISPFVGWIDPVAAVCADGVEVDRIFTVPLAHAMRPANYHARLRRHAGRDYRIYSIDHDGNHIWGATAGMLIGLAQRVAIVRGQPFLPAAGGRDASLG